MLTLKSEERSGWIGSFFGKRRDGFSKWKAYEMPEQFYTKYPEFCKFLENSPLLSQIKVSKDRPCEQDGEPSLLVEGVHTKWTQIKQRFESVYSKQFDEEFVVDKATREVYTYLDDGQGLQKHHPFLSHRKVISTLSEQEVGVLLEYARQFVRANEIELPDSEKENRAEKRVHVLQIVSSYTHKGNSHLHSLLINPNHPYIRLVTSKEIPSLNIRTGDVYEVGYRSKNRITFPCSQKKGFEIMQLLPFMATQGIFRSPDAAEYIPFDLKFVTNIPVSAEEAEALIYFTERYQREYINLGSGIGFHLASQNCTTYISKVLQEIDLSVPTEISAAQLIKKIVPQVFISIAEGLEKGKQLLSQGLGTVFPVSIHTRFKKLINTIVAIAKSAFDLLAALPVTLFHLALGDAVGEGGRAFVLTGEPPKEIRCGLGNWKKWFSLSHYRFHVPGVLQEWQRMQTTTVVYKQPVRLTLLPIQCTSNERP